MPLVDLAQRPDLVPVVAGWIWKEWASLLTQQSQAAFEAWFRENRRGQGIPATLVWLEAGEPVATVSLEADDMDTRPDLGPWLASLYVQPGWRGRGLGKQLVHAVEERARELGVRELFLFTPGQERFYTALGWEPLDSCEYRSVTVTILRRAF